MCLVIVAPRHNWQDINHTIDHMIRHCNVRDVWFTEPVNQTQERTITPVTTTIKIYATDMDMETAMLICHKVADVFTTLLFNDRLPQAHEPIEVYPRGSDLHWEAWMDEMEQRRLDPNLPISDDE